MDISRGSNLANQELPGKEMAGFDRIEEEYKDSDYHCQQNIFRAFIPSSPVMETASFHSHSQSETTETISISMPSSYKENNLQNNKKVSFIDNRAVSFNNYTVNSFSTPTTKYDDKQAKFRPQPMALNSQLDDLDQVTRSQNNLETPPKSPKIDRPRDPRFDYFKTKSGRFERQLSFLRGKPQEAAPVAKDSRSSDRERLPVDRYYAALEGPELETLRAKEEILLPDDKLWPFLLRFPISSFGICLGLSSQAILWKTLAISSSTKFLRVNAGINLVLWCISVALLLIIFSIYLLKIVFYFEAVRREYYHPIRINFFFAPWIASLFLALGVPPLVAKNLDPILWYILMAPILCLELKIYGQWMSGGRRRLSKVANPSNHLSVVGNFVGALLGASMGLKEGPLFFFAIGLAHYTVLFVTLYQRLPTNETLPKELHPVFFLFVAAPSVASMAWAKLQGSFDYGSRISYFIALFLYFSLAIRVNFFIGFKFSLAWWAYTFPMTGAAIATIKYANEVPNIVTKCLSVILSATSTLTVTSLFVTTILHAFLLRDLFPNDLAIAISDRRPKSTMSWLYRSGSSENIAHYLKFTDADTECPDIESSVTRAGHISKVVDCSRSIEVHKDQPCTGNW